MREHKYMYFGGSGEPNPTPRLSQRLEEAFTNLSGLQQPAHSSSAEEAAEDRAARPRAEEEIRDLVRDVAMA